MSLFPLTSSACAKSSSPLSAASAVSTPSAEANSAKPNDLGLLLPGSVTRFQLSRLPHASSMARIRSSGTPSAICTRATRLDEVSSLGDDKGSLGARQELAG